ncbi:MAG TPA: MBL fold metallo-hydrolase [Rhizomicrobium sp.]|nr:MBL fold metallo-hydrolase [Rhizomicrobium sp.]
MNFDRSLDVAAGQEVRLSPLVSRLLAPNPGSFTFKGTGVHIVGAGPNVAVIDPGPDMPAHLEALKRALGSRRVSHILVTHTHRDHSPAAAALKAWSGARTHGLPLATAATAGEGMVDEAHDYDFVPDMRVEDGMRIAGDDFTLECVVTPGHTANHVCYGLVEEKALFSGDHVMGWSTSVIAPPDGNMGQYLASLEKLKARDDGILYPTHGSPIVHPRDWIGQLIAHRHGREAQILKGLRDGADTIVLLVGRLYPDLPPALRPAAAQQVKAHLDHLMEQDAVARVGDAYSLK